MPTKRAHVLCILCCFVDTVLFDFKLTTTTFFGGLLLPHQHGSEIHTSGDGDVQAERVFLHSVLVLNLTTVFSFVLLLDFGESEDDLPRGIGPALASRLGGQVLRAL